MNWKTNNRPSVGLEPFKNCLDGQIQGTTTEIFIEVIKLNLELIKGKRKGENILTWLFSDYNVGIETILHRNI